MVWVEEARHIGEYRIHVRFSDGASGEIDLTRLVTEDPRAGTPIQRPWRRSDGLRRLS